MKTGKLFLCINEKNTKEENEIGQKKNDAGKFYVVFTVFWSR